MFEVYDKFEKKLNEELWNIRISPPLSEAAKISVNSGDGKLNIITEVVDSIPLFNAKYVAPTLKGPRHPEWATREVIWDGVEVYSEKSQNINGVKAKIGLNINESKGKGNIYLRGDGIYFLYLIGIDFPSRDIFLHIMTPKGEYIPEGRIHYKDHFKEGVCESEVAILWERDKLLYTIDNASHEFVFSSKADKKLINSLQEDLRKINSEGLRGFCIRSDVGVGYWDRPKITAYASYFEIRRIK